MSVSLLNSRALGVGKKEVPDSRSIAETELAGLCVGVRERREVCILDTYCPALEDSRGMGGAEMPVHTPPSPEVCGLEIRCAWLEVRLGVEEMRGGTPGEQKQFGAREEKDNCQRGLLQCPRS